MIRLQIPVDAISSTHIDCEGTLKNREFPVAVYTGETNTCKDTVEQSL